MWWCLLEPVRSLAAVILYQLKARGWFMLCTRKMGVKVKTWEIEGRDGCFFSRLGHDSIHWILAIDCNQRWQEWTTLLSVPFSLLLETSGCRGRLIIVFLLTLCRSPSDFCKLYKPYTTTLTTKPVFEPHLLLPLIHWPYLPLARLSRR